MRPPDREPRPWTENRNLDYYQARLDMRNAANAGRRFSFSRHNIPWDGETPQITVPEDGILAFRQWMTKGPEFFLESTVMKLYRWKEVNHDDIAPRPSNESGLYAYKICPSNLLFLGTAMTRPAVCGLVELRGKILEHSDAVYRAEWAAIRYIFIPEKVMEPPDTYAELEQLKLAHVVVTALRKNYPSVPFISVSAAQLSVVLFKLAMHLWHK